MATSTTSIDHLRKIASANNRYQQQLNRLDQLGKQTSCITEAVDKAATNISEGRCRSFIIYGEPQSGKTEMMICLTAKLIDMGYGLVVHLLNDSVQLLQQNLDRFQRSGLAPAAKNFSDVLDPAIDLRKGQHVIFCKKNASDLSRLIQKTAIVKKKVIIDDEADFATPNAKINKGEVTKINDLVSQVLGGGGAYVGVTATPARLDLNNTFENDSERWVNFPPHSEYTGQDVFFPIDAPIQYRLKLLKDQGDQPKFLKEALYRFMATVAYVNLNSPTSTNFSMLVHTSGKKIDHKADKEPIDKVFQGLADVSSGQFEKIVAEVEVQARSLFGEENAPKILEYIVENRARYNIIVMNSERDKNVDFKSATSPAALFTIVIGGNIVSRGVTFDNLLSMFFTRDSKHKIQQDTYVQRARMFGSRKAHVPHFELTIPNQLYVDWHRCFVFHKLALEAIKSGLGSPVWLSDTRIAAVAPSSIDRANVSLDKGEMSFILFNYDPKLEKIAKSSEDAFRRLRSIQKLVGKDALPDYLIRYIERTSPKKGRSVAIHESSSIANYKEGDGINKSKVERAKGFFGAPQMQKDKYPEAIHHLKVFYNAEGRARLFYKFDGNINFIKNLKHD